MTPGKFSIYQKMEMDKMTNVIPQIQNPQR